MGGGQTEAEKLQKYRTLPMQCTASSCKLYMRAGRGGGGGRGEGDGGGHHEAIPGCRCRNKCADAHEQNTHGYTSPWPRLRVHSCQSESEMWVRFTAMPPQRISNSRPWWAELMRGGATEDRGRDGGRKREIRTDVKEVKLVFFSLCLSAESS